MSRERDTPQFTSRYTREGPPGTSLERLIFSGVEAAKLYATPQRFDKIAGDLLVCIPAWLEVGAAMSAPLASAPPVFGTILVTFTLAACIPIMMVDIAGPEDMSKPVRDAMSLLRPHGTLLFAAAVLSGKPKYAFEFSVAGNALVNLGASAQNQYGKKVPDFLLKEPDRLISARQLEESGRQMEKIQSEKPNAANAKGTSEGRVTADPRGSNWIDPPGRLEHITP